MKDDNSPKPKVLVIEDNELAAKAAQITLEANGCFVECINTGAKAIQKLDNHYDLILLDFGLPDMDWIDIVKAIRSEKDVKIATVPIVALTAHDDFDKLKLAEQAGLNGFLAKPFTPNKCKLLLKRIVYDESEKGYFLVEHKND